MVRKKMEGNEDRRRRLARLARSLGRRASELLATTGASKQPHRSPRGGRHQTVVTGIGGTACQLAEELGSWPPS
jgi:hypothetical protein